jgi:hypothetical protein
MCDSVTPKHVFPNDALKLVAHLLEEQALPFIEEVQVMMNADIGGTIVPDIYETYLKSLAPGQHAEELTVARESHALRSLMIMVDNQEKIEAIIYPGSQIIAMSDAVCHNLGLQYDPMIQLNIQSANREID